MENLRLDTTGYSSSSQVDSLLLNSQIFRGAVNSIHIHPSGKLALSVSKDKTLQMINLLKGKIAFSTKLEKVGEIIRWNLSGSYYAIVFGSTLRLYSAKVFLLLPYQR